MEDAFLMVKFKYAENMVNSENQPSNCYFMFSCEGKVEECQPSQDPNMYVVNQTYNFPITEGNEPLLITMMNVN